MFEWQNRNRIYLLAVKWLDDSDGEGKFDPPRAEGAKDQSVTRGGYRFLIPQFAYIN
jgi:hypothetical protein